MLRYGIAACAAAALVFAEGFAFSVGSPVASQDYRAKGAAFVFRAQGCAEPAKPQISGTAEGVVKGARQTVALKVMALTKAGVYAVYQNWPAEGEWLVNLKGTCADASAGAISPIGPKGFVRESSKFFPRAATSAEIETSLKEIAKGGNK